MAISAEYIERLIRRNEVIQNGIAPQSEILGEKQFQKFLSMDSANKKKSEVLNNMQKQIQYMTKLLYSQVHYSVQSLELSDIIRTGSMNGDGEYIVRFGFASDAVFRPSVVQDRSIASKWDRYSELNGKFGTDDIVLQLTKGYAARDSIWYSDYDTGDWKWTRKSYTPPIDFVAEAVEMFNEKSDSEFVQTEETKVYAGGGKMKKIKTTYRVPSYAYLVGDYK